MCTPLKLYGRIFLRLFGVSLCFSGKMEDLEKDREQEEKSSREIHYQRRLAFL